MSKVELLVPAGNMQALIAAVQNGADAVYFAGKKYGARAYANNFSNEEIIEAINYCHMHSVKVYITMNTVLFPDEIEGAFKYACFLHENNVDALIIQDFGLLEILRKRLPTLELHASTQMHLHNVNSLTIIKNLGITRAVVARETPVELVKEMSEVGIDLEVFVFGALCVCYSGQCYMSITNGNRSGNRGECAQPCRLKYELYENDRKIDLDDEYLLSPKDLYTLDNIGELIEANISSFKVEGRMKRPEYVALITSQYRKAIDAYYEKRKFVPNIVEVKKIHNRGFTSGYLFSQKNENLMNPSRPNHIGIPVGKVIGYGNNMVNIKLTHPINQQDGLRILDTTDYGIMANKIYKNNLLVNSADKGDIVSFEFSNKVTIGSQMVLTSDIKQLQVLQKTFQNPQRLSNISTTFCAQVGKPLRIECTFENYNACFESEEIVQPANKQPISANRIIEQLSKVNELPFVLSPIDMQVDDNIFVSIKAINELRRNVISQIKEQISKGSNIEIKEYSCDIPSKVTSDVSVIVNNLEQYEVVKEFPFEIYTDNINLHNEVQDIGYVTLRSNENDETCASQKLYISELGPVKHIASNSTSSHYFNINNAYALALMNQLGFNKVGLSTELSFDRTVELVKQYKNIYGNDPNVEVLLYGRRDAMISKFNIAEMYNLEGNLSLKQRSQKYRVLITDNKHSRILEPSPYNTIENIHEYKNNGITNFVVQFAIEDKNEILKIMKDLKQALS